MEFATEAVYPIGNGIFIKQALGHHAGVSLTELTRGGYSQ
jgi:hypothetical protein